MSNAFYIVLQVILAAAQLSHMWLCVSWRGFYLRYYLDFAYTSAYWSAENAAFKRKAM